MHLFASRSRRPALVAAFLLAAACGSDASQLDGSARSTAQEAQVPDEIERATGVNEGAGVGGSASEEWSPSGINHIVHWSEVGVVGTVASVARVANDKWGMGYIQASIAVEKTLFGEAEVGTMIEFAQLDPRGSQ